MQKFVVCLLLIAHYGILAQKEMKFERYTIDDGLPASYVLDIFQDYKGFIWFGMRGGCCRFDGFSFRTFKVVTLNGTEKLQTWVNSIVEDTMNRLWIGETGQYGLLLFDSDNEVFINYTKKLGLPEYHEKISINTMYCDSEGVLWLGIEDYGIVQYNTKTEETKHFDYKPDNPNSVPTGFFRSITEDHNSNIWIGTSEKLCRFDREKQQFIYYEIIGNNGVMSISEDSDKNIWVAIDNSGLSIYDQQSDKFEIVFNNSGNSGFLIEGPDPICEDANNQLWVGTYKGISIINKNNKTCHSYFHDENNPESLSSDIIKDIILDKTGNIWIGTSEGVCKLKTNKFNTYRYSANKSSISQNRVQYITEDRFSNIWIATPRGIDIFNRTKNEFTFFAGYNNADNNGTSKPPIAFCEDNTQGMWIGTYEGGLNYYNYRTKHFTYYLPDKNNPKSLNNNIIFSVFIDKNNNLWIGTWGGGLNLFNRNTQEFSHFKYDENNSKSLQSNYIRCIHQDVNKNIWIGTVDGVAVLEDIASGSFSKLIDGKTIKTNNQLNIYSLLDTNNGKFLWIATNFGLLCYNQSDKTFNQYNEDNGLPSSKIYGILEDNSKNLWISTSNGLVKATTDYTNDEPNLKFIMYKKTDGLQGNEFLPASCNKLKDGSMVFGGTGGFSLFNPDSIKDNMFSPLLALTALEISNKLVHIGEEVNGQIVLDKSVTNNKSVVLNHDNNNFSIEFVALHFNQPEKNIYTYKLEGFDNKWNVTDFSNRKANYMNLAGGEYVFKVKASNCNGIWNNEGISLNITILKFPTHITLDYMAFLLLNSRSNLKTKTS